MSFNEIDDTLVAYFKQMLDEETAHSDETSKEGLTETEKELSALQHDVTPIENDENDVDVLTRGNLINDNNIFNKLIEVCKQSIKEVKEGNNTNNSNKAQHISEKLKESLKGEWFVSIADTSNNDFDFKCTMVEAKNVITLLYQKQMEIYIFPLGKVLTQF